MDHQAVGRTRIRPAWIVAAGLVVLALVALGVPLVSLLYVGVLLLCPLLMAGMHGGHGQGHDHDAQQGHSDRPSPDDPASSTHPSSHSLEGGRS